MNVLHIKFWTSSTFSSSSGCLIIIVVGKWFIIIIVFWVFHRIHRGWQVVHRHQHHHQYATDFSNTGTSPSWIWLVRTLRTILHNNNILATDTIGSSSSFTSSSPLFHHITILDFGWRTANAHTHFHTTSKQFFKHSNICWFKHSIGAIPTVFIGSSCGTISDQRWLMWQSAMR